MARSDSCYLPSCEESTTFTPNHSSVPRKAATYYPTPLGSPQLLSAIDEQGLAYPYIPRSSVMDQNGSSRRQYSGSGYASQQSHHSQPRQGNVASQGQYVAAPTGERIRQSPYLQQSPASMERTSSDGQQIYSFAASAQYAGTQTLPSNAISYGQEMPAPDAPRQQIQHYSQYGPNFLYSMAPPQAAAAAYEQLPDYRQRSRTDSETLPAQFGVPQAAQYFLAGNPSGSSMPASELTGQPLSSHYQQTDTYVQAVSASANAYTNTIMDPGQSAAYSAYTQQSQYAAQQQTPSDDQAFEHYQSQIRNIFTLAHHSLLQEVGAQLMEISRYLLNNVEALGLTRDDETLHDGRIRLWDEFNQAWLVTLQRQFDLTQESMQTGQQPSNGQSLMTVGVLERLSQELVRLCDMVERHGLVDYQMGVAEEEIMDLLLRCLSLLNGGNGEARPAPELSVTGSTRSR